MWSVVILAAALSRVSAQSMSAFPASLTSLCSSLAGCYAQSSCAASICSYCLPLGDSTITSCCQQNSPGLCFETAFDTTSVDPQSVSCLSAGSVLESCSSATPDLLSLAPTSIAQCLCFSNQVFRPQYDTWQAQCFSYLTSVSPSFQPATFLATICSSYEQLMGSSLSGSVTTTGSSAAVTAASSSSPVTSASLFTPTRTSPSPTVTTTSSSVFVQTNVVPTTTSTSSAAAVMCMPTINAWAMLPLYAFHGLWAN